MEQLPLNSQESVSEVRNNMPEAAIKKLPTKAERLSEVFAVLDTLKEGPKIAGRIFITPRELSVLYSDLIHEDLDFKNSNHSQVELDAIHISPKELEEYLGLHGVSIMTDEEQKVAYARAHLPKPKTVLRNPNPVPAPTHPSGISFKDKAAHDNTLED